MQPQLQPQLQPWVHVLTGVTTSCSMPRSLHPCAAKVLLLDEPTNHLDWEAIDWLADHLSDPRRCT